MIKSATSLLIASAIAGVLISCGGPQNSQLLHDIDEPVRETHSGQWVDLGNSDFERIVLARLYPDAPPLSADHELVKRAKFWVNTLDQKIREKNPELLANVPRLNTAVIKTKSANAFIASSFVCFELGATFPSHPAGTAIDATYIDLEDGRTYQWPEAMTCAEESNPATLMTALEAFNTNSTDCKFELVNGKIEIADACPMADTSDVYSTKKIVIRQIANWVTITSALFNTMEDEAAFVAIIGHELGHYYRSHGLAKSAEYGFYYQLEDRNPDHKPARDESLQEFGNLAYASAQTAVIADTFQEVENQTLPSSMYFAAGDIAYVHCANNRGCAPSCKTVSALSEDPVFIEAMGKFPFLELDATETYFQFESDVTTCLATIPYDTRNNSAWNSIITSIKTPVWDPISSLLTEPGKRYVKDQLNSVSEIVAEPMAATNALEVIQGISSDLNLKFGAAHRVLSRAQSERLGQYTTEQEADELAAEWLDLIGLNPDSVVDSFIYLAGDAKDSLAGFSFGGPKCKELRDANWTDEAGNEIFVPIGNYAEIHHSSCYRAYNADRDVKAHNYQTKDHTISAPGNITWEEIIEISKDLFPETLLTETTTTETQQPEDSELLKFLGAHDPLKTCIFAKNK